MNGRVKDADHAIGASSIQIVVVTGQPRWVGRCAADRNCNVRDPARSIAAGVPENVVFEVARIVNNVAVKGEGV